jgi:hypothetical protein
MERQCSYIKEEASHQNVKAIEMRADPSNQQEQGGLVSQHVRQ